MTYGEQEPVRIPDAGKGSGMAEEKKTHGITVNTDDTWPGDVFEGEHYLYRRDENGNLILNDRDTLEMCFKMGEITEEEYTRELEYLKEHAEEIGKSIPDLKRGSKKLVAFFSASGVTRKLASRLAEAINADLHEIIPEEPYTKADLNWQDRGSRSSVEMNDKSIRPAVANSVEHIDQYDTIFLGFPIWWYVAPTIVCTFLEQYDLRGMTIVPFATSGSSGMGRTNAELGGSALGARLLEGKRFPADASAEELRAWVEQVMG